MRLLAAIVLAGLAAPTFAQPRTVPPSGPPAGSPPAPPSASPADGWQPRTTAELLVLDKVRAQPSSLSVRMGQSATYGSLTITLRGCVTRAPDLPQDSAAFLEVVDSRPGAPGFRGWMLANEPALGQLEHPIYDVRLVACR